MLRVHEVADKGSFRRFVDLPVALHRHEPRWGPTLPTLERRRLDPARHPFFTDGDAAYLLAWDGGRTLARCTAHVDGAGEGWFGFLEAPAGGAGPEAVARLLDRARAWLAGRGCTRMRGPASFTVEEEAGVRVAGHDVPAITGWPWHPPGLDGVLRAWGLEPCGERPAWRLTPAEGVPARDGTAAAARPSEAARRGDGERGPGAEVPLVGPYADPRLLLRAPAGRVVAVPDLAGGMRGRRFGAAWSLARRARTRSWEGAAVLSLEGDPAALVPSLLQAAGAAGYGWLLAPWAPDGRPPTVVHRLYAAEL